MKKLNDEQNILWQAYLAMKKEVEQESRKAIAKPNKFYREQFKGIEPMELEDRKGYIKQLQDFFEKRKDECKT